MSEPTDAFVGGSSRRASYTQHTWQYCEVGSKKTVGERAINVE